MELGELFCRACGELQSRSIRFAVAGGFAAVLYRDQNRLTDDADIAILADKHELQIAEEILRGLGLDKIETSRIADLEGGPLFAIQNRSTPPAILVGRSTRQERGPGVDIILSTVPWVLTALPRAEQNRIDFGFGAIPTITLEDVIVAKLYARKGIYRPKDEDDLLSIFAAHHDPDFAYLNARMQALRVVVPNSIRKKAPVPLQKISKDIERRIRSKTGA